MAGRLIVGVDVGGTFTDVFVLDEAANTVRIAKTPSTPADQSDGVRRGMALEVEDLAAITTVVHGTTVGTNALLERKGATIGVITTRGFRDVLEMRRRDRPATWGLRGNFTPVAPRDLRLEVRERTLADGTVREPVDPVEVEAAARTLLARGAEALAIVFINAYANGSNERAALEAVRRMWPNTHLNISSAILPEIREFERSSTTALNAYLQPTIGRYLDRLQTALRDDGFGGDVLIVQSAGGVMAVDTACRFPVRTALSGPAAGVIAAGAISSAAGFPDIVTGDMGGTSFDVSLVRGGQTVLAPQTSVDFGLVIRTPMIEITTIGAGGGSIARVDGGGILQIGPQSAGSDPGPVCYGGGNDRPTVTDANVVLGRIDAERPIGGKLARLDVPAARRALARAIGEPLGLSVEAAAEAVIRVANARMAGAIRLVSVERGLDPKEFAFFPFGGGGALHAGALMEEVGFGAVLIPRFPGITSALGCVIADLRHDFVRTVNAATASLDLAALTRDMEAHAEEGLALLHRSAVSLEGREIVHELDMSYLGQTHTVPVRIASYAADGAPEVSRASVDAAFDAAYRNAFWPPSRRDRHADRQSAHRHHRRAPQVQPGDAGPAWRRLARAGPPRHAPRFRRWSLAGYPRLRPPRPADRRLHQRPSHPPTGRHHGLRRPRPQRHRRPPRQSRAATCRRARQRRR